MRLSTPRAERVTAKRQSEYDLISSQQLLIPGIKAKDVVDVLVGVKATELETASQGLQQLGYVLEGQRPGHYCLCWPQPDNREAVIHVVDSQGEIYRARLLFRDRLRAKPDLAVSYEALKLAVAAQTDVWGEYTAQKADFVR